MLSLLTSAARLLPFLAGVVLLPGPPPAAAADGWSAAGKIRGVALQSKPTVAGQRAYRGAVTVCTDVASLQQFVADASRLEEWIPFTESARALPMDGGSSLYYLRTRAPWPFEDRDMVYRLTPEPPAADGAIRIRLQGVPDALPEQQGAVRMRAAEGLWTLTPADGRIGVALRLAVDPGRAPAFFANRRLAATVGGSLANLAEQFPCDAAGAAGAIRAS